MLAIVIHHKFLFGLNPMGFLIDLLASSTHSFGPLYIYSMYEICEGL